MVGETHRSPRNLPIAPHFEAERHFPMPADLSDSFDANHSRRCLLRLLATFSCVPYTSQLFRILASGVRSSFCKVLGSHSFPLASVTARLVESNLQFYFLSLHSLPEPYSRLVTHP